MRFGDDFDPVSLGRVVGFNMETLSDDGGQAGQQMHVRVLFADGGALVMRAAIGESLTLDVRPVFKGLAEGQRFQEDTCDYVKQDGTKCGAHVGWGVPLLHLRRCDDHANVDDHEHHQ